MKLLVVSQYFHPETFIINELCLELDRLGHEVTVLTGKPNYPDGKLFSGYKVWGFQKENYGKSVTVLRVPLWPRKKSNRINLFFNYISFVFFAFFFGPFLLLNKKFDQILVFAVSPITQAIPAILLSKIKKAPLAVWVLDLWPESLSVTNTFKSRILLSIVEQMVKLIYKFTDLILVPSKAFYEPIYKIYPKAKIEYFPNSSKLLVDDANIVLPSELELVLKNNFCFTFAGNIGIAQSIETIVEAAKILKDKKDIKFVLVGSGSSLDWVKDQIKEFNLDNIFLAGRFDISYMPAIYKLSKAMLLTLKSDEIMKFTLPWKTQTYMAAEKPIIAAIDGEAVRVIEEANCGFCGPAEDAKVLSENLLKFYNLGENEREKLGHSALDYFKSNFIMDMQLSRLVKLFKERAN